MGVLDTLAQMNMAQRERNMLAAQNIGQNLSKVNAIMLGQKFARQGDFSVQGIAKFMAENQLDENSMGTIIKLTQAVSELQPKFGYGEKVGVYAQTGPQAGKVVAPVQPDLPKNLEESLARKTADEDPSTIFMLKKGLSQNEPQTPSGMREFELSFYGKERPDLRGTEQYLKDRQAFDDSLRANKGMKIVSDGKGGFEILTNADQESSLTAPTMNKVQEKALNASEGLRRMRGIIDSFDPNFLNKPFRATQAMNNLFEGWGLKKLDDGEQVKLEDYTAFGRKAIENINLYIKELTGAQMSEAEAKRLRMAMPDFGDSWWRGDGPTKFKTKMLDVYKQSTLANARYNYVMNNGFTIGKNDNGEAVAFLDGDGKSISLDDIERIMDKRGEELEASGMSDADVMKQLSREFGMAF